jgi:hypothetical protein
MNKTIDRKQMIMAWHVDDLKISHVDAKAVDCFTFGREAPVTQSRRKIHDYLGMTLDHLVTRLTIKSEMIHHSHESSHRLAPVL